MPFSVRFKVYWALTDPDEITSYIETLKLVEQTEEELYMKYNILKIYKNIPRIEVYAKYLSPLRWGDVAVVSIELTEENERKMRYDFTIFNETTNKPAVKGYVAFACVDLEEFRSVKCPEELVKAWRSTKTQS